MVKRFLTCSQRSGWYATVIMVFFTFLGHITCQAALADSVDKKKSEKTKIEQGIKKYQINIRRLDHGIEKQQDHIAKTRQQERELLTELQDIETRLLEQQKKLGVLEGRITQQDNIITLKNQEIASIGWDKRAVQLHLQKRIQAYYKMGNIGFMNVTFSSKSLPELLSFHESFQSLIKYDQNVIATYRQAIDELKKSVETLEIEEALLEDFISQNKEKQDKIHLIRQEKEALLARVQTQEQLHEKAITELEEAAKALTTALNRLKKKDETFDQTFLNSKRKIPPPVPGKLISGFQDEVVNLLGIKSVSQGIALKAPNGTIIRAVHAGEVTYSGYLRGYGNTVIVNHGYQYYSICSRIERILAKNGQRVEEGVEIGIMGDTATLMSEGLYFEIRQDSTPLDPLKWLDPSKIQM